MEWGNRWSATLRGTSAATGGEGVGDVRRDWGADKWVWEGLLFPQSASRDDEEGEGGCGYVCASEPPCMCSHV